MSSSHDDVTTYFGDLAGVYADHRPGYPLDVMRAAIDGLDALDGGTRDDRVHVVDVGCGTGISARLLAEAGASVTAVDPSPGMLAEAQRQPSDGITYAEGRAEKLPVADAAAALVLCAQSFHWFDHPVAFAEFRRVLVPGGRLALLWNVRQETDAMTTAYEDIVRRAQADAAAHGKTVHTIRSHRPGPESGFENVRTLSFDNPQHLDWSALLGRVRSASYFPVDDPLKSELEGELRRHYETNERDGRITLAQHAELTVGELPR